MSKKEKKKNAQKKSSAVKTGKTVELIYSLKAGKYQNYLIYLPVLLTIITGIYFVYDSFDKNGYFGFPLDDPWIHLTFAKNFVDYGSFSYFKNEMVTSGSTSPIYTILLSLLFLVSNNEFIISYIPGILFGALFVFAFIKIAGNEFNGFPLLALVTTLLVALQPKLNLINVSGMETSMFLFFITGSIYAYRYKKIVLLGIMLGLTIWCRPDGLVLWIAIAFDFFLRRNYFKKDDNSDNKFSTGEISKAFSIAFIMAAGYFIFNYLLSGSFLPNTYKAKLEYYQNSSRANFLENDVLKYFTQSEFVIIWVPFLVGLVAIIKSFFKKEYKTLLVCLIFILGLIAVYYIKLPFAHRFGRYLMPVIPFYILIAFSGVKIVVDFLHTKLSGGRSQLSNMVFILFLIAGISITFNEISTNVKEYSLLCKYHNERHVAAGKWIDANTDTNDIIATHDVGAIAYYGKRKLVDMAGLVTPELIDHLNNRMYSEYMNDYLSKQKVNYVVTLKNWFEVVNDKPVYVPVHEFEFLEIFKYEQGRTHIQPKEVSQMNQAAIQMLQSGNSANAVQLLNQSLALDPRSSQTYFLLGASYESLRNYSRAENNFNKALENYPAYTEAYFGLAQSSFNQKKFEEANYYVNKCLGLDPNYMPAKQLLDRINPLLEK
ncbi:MAG: tetratricopeptide repeat protein [Ignavibacteriales bacterium]|nr:MAG: tetratricopeptide repeat protein [Ignavibacteriales bacterium]